MSRILAELRPNGDLVSFAASPIDVAGLLIYFSGYIANLDEIVSGISDRFCNIDPSAVCMAIGYRKWGAALNKHVFGEFALVIVDVEAKSILLTQDCLGLVPLYYRLNQSGIFFASCIEDLSHDLGYDDLDEDYIADYLCFGDHFGERTPFKQIKCLTPGISVYFNRVMLKKVKGWAFESITPICHGDLREYCEELKRLLTEGVKAALPPEGIALCEVSGGLDSSTIACVASGCFPRERLHALSYVYSESQTADESRWSKVVVDRCDIKWHQLDVDSVRPFTHLPDFCSQPHHTMVNAAFNQAYRNILRENGIAVVLSGAGGDGVLLGDGPEPFYLADMFWKGQFIHVWKDLRDWARDSEEPGSIMYWLNRCVTTASANKLRGLLIQSCPRKISWLSADYLLGRDRNGRQRKTWVPSGAAGVAESWFLERVMRSAKVVSLRDYTNNIGVNFRHPLLYTPLVKFMCAIPWKLKFSSSQDRLLQRQTFAQILPPEIASRRSKGDPSQATYTGLESGDWWSAVREGTQLVSRDYVNKDSWTSAVDLARLGRCESIIHFKAAATLEVWLANLQCSGHQMGKKQDGRVEEYKL